MKNVMKKEQLIAIFSMVAVLFILALYVVQSGRIAELEYQVKNGAMSAQNVEQSDAEPKKMRDSRENGEALGGNNPYLNHDEPIEDYANIDGKIITKNLSFDGETPFVASIDSSEYVTFDKLNEDDYVISYDRVPDSFGMEMWLYIQDGEAAAPAKGEVSNPEYEFIQNTDGIVFELSYSDINNYFLTINDKKESFKRIVARSGLDKTFTLDYMASEAEQAEAYFIQNILENVNRADQYRVNLFDQDRGKKHTYKWNKTQEIDIYTPYTFAKERGALFMDDYPLGRVGMWVNEEIDYAPYAYVDSSDNINIDGTFVSGEFYRKQDGGSLLLIENLDADGGEVSSLLFFYGDESLPAVYELLNLMEIK